MPAWLSASLVAAAAAAAYLLLAGSMNASELAFAAAVAVAVTASAITQPARQDRRIDVPRPRLLPLLGNLLTEIPAVAAAFLRPPPPVDPTWTPARARSSGERARAALLTSATPDGIVLDITPSALAEAGDAMLVHHLTPPRLASAAAP